MDTCINMKTFQPVPRVVGLKSQALCQPWEALCQPREALGLLLLLLQEMLLNLMKNYKQGTNYWGCCLPKQQ